MQYFPIRDDISFRALLAEVDYAGKLVTRAQKSGQLDPELARRAKHHVKRFKKQLNHIQRLAATGSYEQMRAEVMRALTSRHAKISAAILHPAPHGHLNFGSLEQRAQTIDLFWPCLDPIAVSVEPKEQGGHRLIHHPGWRHHARQWIARAAFTAAGVGSEFDANSKGLGAARVIHAMQGDIEDGFRFWAIADIKNCFPTVKLGHLQGIMPIDVEALSSVIFTGENVPVQLFKDGTPISDSTLEKEARAGLAQGSKLSPLLASALLGRELRAIAPKANPVVSYVDDIAMGARVQEEAESFVQALSQRLASLKAGPLQLKHAEVYDALIGVSYLGRKIRLGIWNGEKSARVTPTSQSFDRMYHRALQRFGEALPAYADEDEPNELDRYIERAARAYGWKASDVAIYDVKTRMLLRYMNYFEEEAGDAS